MTNIIWISRLKVANASFINTYIQFRWVLGMLWCSSTILLHSITKSVYIQVNILPLMLHFLRQNISTESPTMKWFNENIFQYLRHMFEITWIMERGIKKTIMLSPPKPQSQRDMAQTLAPAEINHRNGPRTTHFYTSV